MMLQLCALAACLAAGGAVSLDDVIRNLTQRALLAGDVVSRSGGAPGPASCNMENGDVGECVPYYLCNSTTNRFITDGSYIFEPRAVQCPDIIHVCCLPPARRPAPQPPPAKVGCGWSNGSVPSLASRVGGGSSSSFAELPWMVAVLRYYIPGQEQATAYQAGGSLIHPSVVLTAAHRVREYPAAQLLARAGARDAAAAGDRLPAQVRNVKEVVIHEAFQEGNLHNDIGLLFLVAPMDLAPNVGLACLPPPGARPRRGARCLVSGWGNETMDSTSSQPGVLMKVEVPVVEHAACQESLRQTRLGRYFVLDASFVCAGDEGGDACTGDGGSPLVCPSEDNAARFVQHGIVAWGIGCRSATPGVYAAAGRLRPWVDRQVARRGFDPAVYTIQT